MPDKSLTSKEQKVVDEFNSARPGLGELVEKEIRNSNSGVSELIESIDDSEIKVKESTSNNSFVYRRIGG
ncbi:MAG: hypothetical protein WBA07_01585 [Rivularia sp. (in: cyanobacteria)]